MSRSLGRNGRNQYEGTLIIGAGNLVDKHENNGWQFVTGHRRNATVEKLAAFTNLEAKEERLRGQRKTSMDLSRSSESRLPIP